MKTRNTMVLELATLRNVAAIHEAKIAAAVDAKHEAAIAFFDAWGFEAFDAPEGVAVAYENAEAVLESLSDDTGYFWTVSRIRDLATIVEGNGTGQLMFFSTAGEPDWSCGTVWGIGGMPKADPSVADFIARTLGYTAAA